MSKSITLTSAAIVLAASLVTVAEARPPIGGRASIQGSGGRGATATRSGMRGGGSSQITRGVQTNAGYGATTTRGGSVSGNTYSGGATHTANNGNTAGRSTTATANSNGSADYSSTATGPTGQSGTVSGTISRAPQ